jgi:hypothetical protein
MDGQQALEYDGLRRKRAEHNRPQAGIPIERQH